MSTEIKEMNTNIVEGDLKFKQMAHFAFTNQCVNQKKDEATNIWKITTTRRTNGGYGVGSSKTAYFIGESKKRYNSLAEVLKAYNQQAL